MARKRKPAYQVISIFGQIETVVAEAMVAEGKLTRWPDDFLASAPPEMMVNEFDQRARMVVTIPARHEAEFERRVAELRA